MNIEVGQQFNPDVISSSTTANENSNIMSLTTTTSSETPSPTSTNPINAASSASVPVANMNGKSTTQSQKKTPSSGRPSKNSSKDMFKTETERHMKMRDLFMNDPMIKQVEQHAKKNIEMLDNLQKKWDDEQNHKRKKELSKHIPGPLQGKGQKIEDVMKHLEDLIVFENFEEEEKDLSKFSRAVFKEMDEHAQVAVITHSIAAYISMLKDSHLQKLSTRILSDTTLWMSRLFRFKDSSAYFSSDDREGVVKVCRLALHENYVKYSTDGFEALYSKPPVIYVSAAAGPGLGQHLCSQLGLPLSCLCIVPGRSDIDAQHKMDIEFLDRQIIDDVNSGKIPLFLMACIGTPVMGEVDHIKALQDICKKHNIWLHLEGHTLATLTWFSVPTAVMPATTSDSMTVHLGTWLSLPSLPYTTIFKHTDPARVHAAGLSTYTVKNKLDCIPLWVCLQTIGHEGIVDRIKHCVEMSSLLVEKLRLLPAVNILKGMVERPRRRVSGDNEDETVSLSSLISKAVNALLVFEIASPTIVFRYTAAKPVKISSSTADSENSEQSAEEHATRYFNALNRWLVDTLNRENHCVQVTAVEIDDVGLCIRFSALETVQAMGTKRENILEFVKCFSQQIEILDATLKERENFQSVVSCQDNLRVVDLPDWAGLGAVQYIPNEWLPMLGNLPAYGVQDINSSNQELLIELQTNDNAFALGTSLEGLKCIRFGLITPATDVDELVALVCNTGRKLEESSRAMEKMTEMIKKGIEEANKDLVKEHEEKLLQEGVLRQVPIVGSLVSWLSPPPKDVTKGRMFNLKSGKISSTEDIYKHHMQILPEMSPDNKTKRALQPKALISEQMNGDVQHSESVDEQQTDLDVGNGIEVASVAAVNDGSKPK